MLPALGPLPYAAARSVPNSAMMRSSMILMAWLGQLLQELVEGGCPGSLELAGHGHVAAVSADWDVPGSRARAAQVEQRLNIAGEDEIVPEIILRPRLGSRTYLADECSGSMISDKPQFLALKLLGKTLKYSTDISGAGCGCVAKLYLAPLQQNNQPSDCHDYYCDASGICGVRCAEIDVQEANQHSWHTTLHTAGDFAGLAQGLGGVASGPWNETVYGIGGRCIDTSKPFEVMVSFPVHSISGMLAAVNVTLSQDSQNCALELWHDRYGVSGKDGLVELSEVLAAGVTPIISYWASDDLPWLEDAGQCDLEAKNHCSSTIAFSGLSVEEIHQQPPVCQRCPVGHCEQELDGACRWFSGGWLSGLESYHCKVKDCKDVPNGSKISNCWHWHEVPYYSVSDRYFPCKEAEQQSLHQAAGPVPWIYKPALHSNGDGREKRLSRTTGSTNKTPPEQPNKPNDSSRSRSPLLLVLALIVAGIVAAKGAVFAYERLVLGRTPDCPSYAAFPCHVFPHDTFGQCATAVVCGVDLKNLHGSSPVTSPRQAATIPDIRKEEL